MRCSMFDFYFFLLGALGQGLRAILIKRRKSVPARFFVPQTEKVCRGTKKGRAGAALQHNCSDTKKLGSYSL